MFYERLREYCGKCNRMWPLSSSTWSIYRHRRYRQIDTYTNSVEEDGNVAWVLQQNTHIRHSAVQKLKKFSIWQCWHKVHGKWNVYLVYRLFHFRMEIFMIETKTWACTLKWITCVEYGVRYAQLKCMTLKWDLTTTTTALRQTIRGIACMFVL